MYILENGFKGYVTTCNNSKLTVSKKPKVRTGYCMVDESYSSWVSNLPTKCYVYTKKKRVDNRKYAYIYTKKGRVLATVDTKTFKAYKVEGCLRKTWKPIRRFTFDSWATLLNW